MSVFGRVGWFFNPPDSPWWFLRSLPVYLNRCHRATCPISAAPVLQSKTLPSSPHSISQTRLSGKTLSKLCSITEQACLIFHKPENLAKCIIYKSQINFRLLSWGHVWVLCITQPDKSGVVFSNHQKNIRPFLEGCKSGKIYSAPQLIEDYGPIMHIMWKVSNAFFIYCLADPVHLTDTGSSCRVSVECGDKDHQVLQQRSRLHLSSLET